MDFPRLHVFAALVFRVRVARKSGAPAQQQTATTDRPPDRPTSFLPTLARRVLPNRRGNRISRGRPVVRSSARQPPLGTMPGNMSGYGGSVPYLGSCRSRPWQEQVPGKNANGIPPHAGSHFARGILCGGPSALGSSGGLTDNYARTTKPGFLSSWGRN